MNLLPDFTGAAADKIPRAAAFRPQAAACISMQQNVYLISE
jgi:hypothetical protein